MAPHGRILRSHSKRKPNLVHENRHNQFSLLDLPAEICMNIYEQLFPEGSVDCTFTPTYDAVETEIRRIAGPAPCVNILLASRQIYHEAKNTFKNVFGTFFVLLGPVRYCGINSATTEEMMHITKKHSMQILPHIQRVTLVISTGHHISDTAVSALLGLECRLLRQPSDGWQLFKHLKSLQRVQVAVMGVRYPHVPRGFQAREPIQYKLPATMEGDDCVSIAANILEIRDSLPPQLAGRLTFSDPLNTPFAAHPFKISVYVDATDLEVLDLSKAQVYLDGAKVWMRVRKYISDGGR